MQYIRCSNLMLPDNTALYRKGLIRGEFNLSSNTEVIFFTRRDLIFSEGDFATTLSPGANKTSNIISTPDSDTVALTHNLPAGMWLAGNTLRLGKKKYTKKVTGTM